jgi:plastocyanin
VLGAATFFLPCGFTQAVQIMALTSGSAVAGALLMGAFALGTAPGLLAAGRASSAAAMANAPAVLRGIGVVVIAFAVVTVSGAAKTLVPTLGVAAVTATERTANVIDSGGSQHAAVDVVTSGYAPANTVVYVGEPVTWTLEPTIVSCAGLVDASALGVGTFDAVSEPATVTFTLDTPGTYAYSCRMGMYSGTFTAIERPAP